MAVENHDKKVIERLSSAFDAPAKVERAKDYSQRKEAQMRHLLSVTALGTIVVFLVGAAACELFGMDGVLRDVWGVAGPIVGTMFGYYLAIQRANGNGH